MKLLIILIFFNVFTFSYLEQIEQSKTTFQKTGQDSRLSSFRNPTIPQEPIMNSKNLEEEIAMRVVERYRQIFNFLDSSPVDNELSPKELAIAFDEFKWPKNDPNEFDNVAYAKKVINKYSEKQKMDFVQFCKFMEELWNDENRLENEECQLNFGKAKDTFVNVFDWLDRDKDGMISKEDMLYGISRIMLKDAEQKEIDLIFEKYDREQKGKISKRDFILSAINGMLELSLQKEDE